MRQALPRPRTSAALLIATCAAAACIATPCPAQPTDRAPGTTSTADAAAAIPATVPGKIAAAYIAMFNSTSDDAVAQWETAYRAASRLKAVGMTERVSRVRDMRKDFGTLTVIKVLDSSDNSLAIEVASKDGHPIGMRFIMDKAEPGKLGGIEVSTDGPMARAEPVTREETARTVDQIAKSLESSYVYPAVAAKMAAAVREKLASGAYDRVATDQALARQLTDDLQAVSKDKHLGVRVVPPTNGSEAASQHHVPAPFDPAKDNYGFRKVELLPGNVGYVKFDVFVGESEAQPTAAAAMAFVAHCDALVFDLRQNGGGDPEMIRYLTSYLFATPTHLNDMIDRDGKTVEEYWTLKDVPGSRIAPAVPVYVLTSKRTFSGAEEFSYNLKNLKRATIIGETTGGGAHPVRPEKIGDRFTLRVPYMRANNPISKTNWEGTGVEPDIQVPADQALDRALEQIRKAPHH